VSVKLVALSVGAEPSTILNTAVVYRFTVTVIPSAISVTGKFAPHPVVEGSGMVTGFAPDVLKVMTVLRSTSPLVVSHCTV
jgi:hypothetical protein